MSFQVKRVCTELAEVAAAPATSARRPSQNGVSASASATSDKPTLRRRPSKDPPKPKLKRQTAAVDAYQDPYEVRLDGGPTDPRAQCRHCGRRFNHDRIDKHEEICIVSSSKRNTFDSSKKRVIDDNFVPVSSTASGAGQGRRQQKPSSSSK